MTRLLRLFMLIFLWLFLGSSTAAYGGTIGVQPYLGDSPPINDVVRLRYRLRVNTMTADTLKLIFNSLRLYNPFCVGSTCETYLLESNLYSYWVQYQDTGCVPWPPTNAGPAYFGQAALWMSIPDYNLHGRVGVRPRDESTRQRFPRMMSGIDNISGLTKIETLSQMNIVGKDIRIEYQRGATFDAPLSGWGYRFDPDAGGGNGQPPCIADLPAGTTYRIWTATVRIGDESYSLDFAVPDIHARHIAPWQFFAIVTEFLNKTPDEISAGKGDFQAYYWDFEIQRENASAWIPLRKMEVFYRPGAEENIGWGAKIGRYAGRSVLEISNDTTDTYYKLGSVFELPPGPTLFLRGSFNNWGTMPMEWDAGIWKATARFADNGQFKFDVQGDWSENYGDNPPRDGIVDRNGANIGVGDAGDYRITFDPTSKRYAITRLGGPPCASDTLFFRGTPNGWSAQAMHCVDTKWLTTASFESNGRFKFDVYGDWRRNYGDNAPRDGKLDAGGSDIPVIEAGLYEIEADLRTLSYILRRKGDPLGCGVAQMYLRGTPNGWGATPMTCNPERRFEAMQTFAAANGQFKFDVNGDWSENYGDNPPRDGKAERNGQNIPVAQAGSYLIRFDYRAKTYAVIDTARPCGTATMYLRGTFNGWKNDTPMSCQDGRWLAFVNIPVNGEFKFDVFGDWRINFGDNPPRDGVADGHGANIPVAAGMRSIYFDYPSKTYGISVGR